MLKLNRFLNNIKIASIAALLFKTEIAASINFMQSRDITFRLSKYYLDLLFLNYIMVTCDQEEEEFINVDY